MSEGRKVQIIAQPSSVCVCCQASEVPWHTLACNGCRATLVALGLLTTSPAASEGRPQGPG